MAMCDTCKNNRNHLEKDCEFAPGSCTCQHRTEAQEIFEQRMRLPRLDAAAKMQMVQDVAAVAETGKVYYRETEASLNAAFMPLKKKRRWNRGR